MTVMDELEHVLAKSAQHGRPAEQLTVHLQATRAGATVLRHRVGRIALVEKVLGNLFWEVAELAALAHDAGKVADGFQDMIKGVRSAWGQRHEVLSLGFVPRLVSDEELRLWLAAAIVTHHRPLDGDIGSRRLPIKSQYGSCELDDFRVQLGPVNKADVAALQSWLAAVGGRILRPDGSGLDDAVGHAHQLLQAAFARWTRQGCNAEEGLTAVLLQGAVTLADHLSSAHGALRLDQPLDATFPQRLHADFARRSRTLHPHQRQAAETSGHLLLRAPTGSGKTEAGLLWAARQVGEMHVDCAGVPRVFITLPYLASINAMAGRLGAILGDNSVVGVAHSRAASYYLSTAIAEADGTDASDKARAARKAVARHQATRLFRESIRVGTPYQLLRGTLAGPAHSGILLDSANSVFVLDELHAYEPKPLGFILAAARMWERLGGRVAVLSATLPRALCDIFRETLRDVVHTVVAPAGRIKPRHRLKVRPYRLLDDEAVREARQRLAAGQSVLVVANNVAQAQEIFDLLGPEVRERYGDRDAAILLHSRFRRDHRTHIEERVLARYGTDCPSRLPGLVVATQVVEVSLDVDFDALLTSGAPLEALLQRFGRVNRLGRRQVGDVVVHEPDYRPRKGGRGEEFADGIYPSDSVKPAMAILNRNDGRLVDEEDATGWLDEVYASEWGQRWYADVARNRDAFDELFLTFRYPFRDRTALAARFDEMFDGTEAVLLADIPEYEAALMSATTPADGRLLAADLLIPLPAWAVRLSTYDRTLGVCVVDGEYDEERGLTAVRGVGAQQYRAGEVI